MVNTEVISKLRVKLEDRKIFLQNNLLANIVSNYDGLLFDFPFGGYRIFGNFICNIDYFRCVVF